MQPTNVISLFAQSPTGAQPMHTTPAPEPPETGHPLSTPVPLPDHSGVWEGASHGGGANPPPTAGTPPTDVHGHPSGVGGLLSSFERLRILRTWTDAVRNGENGVEAARRLGASRASICRWQAQLAADGLSLASPDDQLLEALKAGKSTGRPPEFQLTEEEACALRGLVLAKSTQDAIHFSLAIEEFLNHPACLPTTKARLIAIADHAAAHKRAPQWPLSLRRAGLPMLAESATFRGRKHSIAVEMTDRRGLFFLLEDGTRVELDRPHLIWEMDDASDNEPRQHLDPDTGHPVLTRQALWTQDVYSAAILGLSQVARARDAYRIEDIADHVLNCVDTWGLPKYLRLERGSWDSAFFHGFIPEVPGWPTGKAWGGLSPVITILNVFKSKSKGGIESAFNLLQAIAAHASLSLGRTRGEFEAATRALVSAQGTGRPDPSFWSAEQSAATMARVAEIFNQRPKIRRAFGRDAIAPCDLLRDHRGITLPTSERWRFLPIKRLATVRGGHVELAVDHYPQTFRFRVNGNSDTYFDNGFRVLVAFHPSRPHEGCHIFNATLGSRNRDNLSPGEYLLTAPLSEEKPQFDLSGSGAFAPRRTAAAAVQRRFRAIAAAVKIDHAQDSRGKSVTLSIGQTKPAAPKPRPAAKVESDDEHFTGPTPALTSEEVEVWYPSRPRPAVEVEEEHFV